ncbi:MAG TPA: type II toxin-antitoxin system RelE/ParE family toxin [Thermoanaerobaculia bacterium]|nr:type II toxin-antitoxin system RelE/ParE family toxin [Thermoanaerobaculia bacterium]
MASYNLEIKRSAAKDLEDLPAKDRGRIVARIHLLAEDPRPHGAEKLSGQERYRVRQGDYRILYEIHDQVLLIVVVRIGHRREVYRQ